MRQIYGTFMRGVLKLQPALAQEAHGLTAAMVDFWFETAKHFTVESQPHYLYSPRELTRWKVAITGAVENLASMTKRDLIRLFIHEEQRIFGDRLVYPEEHEWTE